MREQQAIKTVIDVLVSIETRDTEQIEYCIHILEELGNELQKLTNQKETIST